MPHPFEESPIAEQDDSSDAFERSWSSDELPQSQQTTAVHRGGAVLKFKLGYLHIFYPCFDSKYMYFFRQKDIVPIQHSNDNIPMEGELLESNCEKSIYDFNDDSDRDEDCYGLSIDESPERRKNKPPDTKAKIASQSK